MLEISSGPSPERSGIERGSRIGSALPGFRRIPPDHV